MKTKIIYISGNEVFEMSQIRAAFEEVRSALGLDSDTVLFGVPVDSDCALESDVANVDAPVVADCVASVDVAPMSDVPESVVEIAPMPEFVPEIAAVVENAPEIVPEPVQKKSRTRRTVSVDAESVAESIVADMSVDDSAADTQSDKVIPILSILSVQDEDEMPQNVVAEDDVAQESASEDVIVEEVVTENVVVEETVPAAESTAVISDIDLDSQIIAPVASDSVAVEKITIGDMIDDVAPVAPVEKTLEELLETMAPLREDMTTEVHDNVDILPEEDMSMSDADTDATLAQLASEFAQTEDKIVTPVRNESQGKIGKLKNILPFKKAKRDDSSLMGDLFGWAGVAANDEDFSIPGFFTQAKKQGA